MSRRHTWDSAEYPHAELTERIIGAAIAVHRALGPGYLENVYENALKHQLQKTGISVEQQQVFSIVYDGVRVGEHRADLIAEGIVLLELKAVEDLIPLYTAQVISTWKASGLQLGLLINFNVAVLKDGVRRIVLTHPGGYKSVWC